MPKTKKTVKHKGKKVSVKTGITLHCFDSKAVIPKDGKVLDNVGKFARRCGLGAYSVYASSSGGASAMTEEQVNGYDGSELWITGRDKPSA